MLKEIEGKPAYIVIVDQVRSATSVGELEQLMSRYKRRLNEMRRSQDRATVGLYHCIVNAFTYYKKEIQAIEARFTSQ